MEDTNTHTAESMAPTYIAYQVRKGSKEKSYWTRNGAAWAHKDGKGFTVQLHSMPQDGRITLRLPSESKKAH